jgi:hypothetical protein
MHEPDAPPPPILDKDGVWRDAMPLEAMTPKQRARYVRMLREDACNAAHKSEIRRAREQLEAFLEVVLNPESGDPTR